MREGSTTSNTPTAIVEVAVVGVRTGERVKDVCGPEPRTQAEWDQMEREVLEMAEEGQGSFQFQRWVDTFPPEHRIQAKLQEIEARRKQHSVADTATELGEVVATLKDRKKKLDALEAEINKRRLRPIIRIGSPKADVLAAFGKPKQVNRTVTRFGVSEQWVYGSMTLYFANNTLEVYQDSRGR